MTEIDKDFVPNRAFMITWTVLSLPALWIANNVGFPWYAIIAFGIVPPLLVTLILFVPILFLRQVMRSDKTTILGVCGIGTVFLAVLGLIAWSHATGHIDWLQSLRYGVIIVIPAIGGWWTSSRRRKNSTTKRRQVP